MRILLCDVPVSAESKFGSYKYVGSASPPYNLLLLGTILRKLGHDVRITLESVGLVELAAMAREFNPTIVGVTFMTMGYPRLKAFTEAMAEAVPDAMIIAGGYHTSLYPADVLVAHPLLFAAFKGEAERSLPKFVEACSYGRPTPSEMKEIEGTWFRDEAGEVQHAPPALPIEDLDEIPFPDYHLIPGFFKHFQSAVARHYFRSPQGYFLTGRGCPYSCYFCGRMLLGSSVRQNSVEYMIELLKHSRKEYGIQSAIFADEFLTQNKKMMYKFVERLHEEGLSKLDWACNGRSNVMDLDYSKALRGAGCRQVAFGIESGSQKILDMLNKKARVERQAEALRVVDQAGMAVYAQFILGSPGETAETIEETRRFILDNPLEFVGICFFTPMPGSHYWETGAHKDHGTLIDENLENFNTFSGIPYLPHGLTKDDLVNARDRIYREFYMRPKRILREFRHIGNASSWAFGMRIGYGLVRDFAHRLAG